MSQIFDIVEELEKERKKNKELEEKIKELEITKMALVPQYSELKEYNAILQDRINKAIEYIENEAIIENLKADHTYITINQDGLLDILKGEENE